MVDCNSLKNSLAFYGGRRSPFHGRATFPHPCFSPTQTPFSARATSQRDIVGIRVSDAKPRGSGLCAEGEAFVLAAPRTESIKHRMCAEETVLCTCACAGMIVGSMSHPNGVNIGPPERPARRAGSSCGIDISCGSTGNLSTLRRRNQVTAVGCGPRFRI